uniref:Sulfotransferase n=1 Tax=Brassica campestris TaxID=3711 RepID=M4FJ49_BRACM
MEVIHSWSCPRSLSTALMYSFAQRDDIEVLDEPLNASFLKATGADRPYRDEIFASMNLAKHRILGLPSELMSKGKHFILIRNPVHILPSFDKVIPLSFLDVGLADLVSIYSDLCQMGTPPPVIDADDLQRNPEATLRGLCHDLDIPFQASMLKWEAGPIPEDGVWASWWYKTVHESTGFSSPRKYPRVGAQDLI